MAAVLVVAGIIVTFELLVRELDLKKRLVDGWLRHEWCSLPGRSDSSVVKVIHADGNNCPLFFVPREHADYPVLWCPWCAAEAREQYRVPTGGDA